MDSGTTEVQPRQRLQALARANRIRQVRADLKRRIADGHVSAAEVILRHQWEVESMVLAELLTSQRQWGDTRCRRFLTPMRLSEGKTIGSMTERQRLAVADRLMNAEYSGLSKATRRFCESASRSATAGQPPTATSRTASPQL
jgi:hypothetical protein